MDSITATAIIAALTVGVTGGATEVGKEILIDAYNALKAILKKKLGHQNEAIKALESAEAKPTSSNQQETLKEELDAAKADQDSDIRQAAQVLLDKINAQPGGSQLIKDIEHINMQGKFNTIIGEASNITIGDTYQGPRQSKGKN